MSAGSEATTIEPIALAALLAAATPFFLEAPETLAFFRPGRAFAIVLDYAAIGSGIVAIALCALAVALSRGTRPEEGRAKLLVGVVLAGVAGVYELGMGLGLY